MNREPSAERRRWSAAVLGKYWAMQAPGAVIVFAVLLFVIEPLDWPGWAAWAGLAAWLAKDALLYPFVWRSYDPGYPMAMPYRMEGSKGVAVDRIDPTGTVSIWGELWQARLRRGTRCIEEGEQVLVTAQDGLTLAVEAVEATRRSH